MSKSGPSGMARLRSLEKQVRAQPDTLVIDIGAAYSKLGFDGDPAPRCIIPTRIFGRGHDSDKLVTLLPYKPNSGPDSEEHKQMEKAVHDLFADFFYNQFQLNPRETRILLLESLYNPSPLRESIAKCLFLTFQVNSILFFPLSIACLHSVGLEEGLVIDVGHTGTRITPISCSTLLISLCRELPGYGGEYMLSWLRFNLCHQASLVRVGTLERVEKKVEEVLTHELVEDIRCRMCAVRSVDETRTPPDALYPLPYHPGLLLSVPGELRHRVAECLFSLSPEEGPDFPVHLIPERTLPQEIVDCVLKLPIDLRVPLAGNIVIAGGPTMLPGFMKRFHQELNRAASNEGQGVLGAKVEFMMHVPRIHANTLGWHGGSVLGACTQAYDARALTREQFNKQGWKVPDWCHLDPEYEFKLDFSRTTAKSHPSYGSPISRSLDPTATFSNPGSKEGVASYFNKLLS